MARGLARSRRSEALGRGLGPGAGDEDGCATWPAPAAGEGAPAPGGQPMSRRIRQLAPVVLPPLPVPYLAYVTKPNLSKTAEKHRKSPRGAPCQSWNVVQDQSDSRIFAKGAEIAPSVLAESDFFDFCIPLISAYLSAYLAYICEPIIERMRKSAPALTSTTENAFGLESTTFAERRPRTKAGISFRIDKTVENAPKNCENCQTRNVAPNQRHDQKRGCEKCKKAPPTGRRMSFGINSFRNRRQGPKWPFYLTVTFAAKTV